MIPLKFDQSPPMNLSININETSNPPPFTVASKTITRSFLSSSTFPTSPTHMEAGRKANNYNTIQLMAIIEHAYSVALGTT